MSTAEPRVLKADPNAYDAAVVDAAIEALTAGQLVVFPTDTVYGLACRVDDPAAVRRLYAAKRRSPEKALPLLLHRADALAEVAVDVTPQVLRLVRRFWPGALTVVVRKSADIPDTVTAGQPTVAVRVPDMRLTRAILTFAPAPVAVSSANLSDEDPACEVGQLPPELLAHVALVIDGGPCPGMKPSTVVDVTEEPPRVLREGPVSAEEIETALRS